MERLAPVPGAEVLPRDGEQLSSLQVKVESTGRIVAGDVRKSRCHGSF